MRKIKIITAVAIILMLSSCSISTFGKFQADEGVPSFIQVGETTRTEILETLGGNKFRVMTGAKNFMGFSNGLVMKIGRNSSNSNYLKITLNSMDLYDMEFAKVSRMGEKKSVTEYSDVYNDMLTDVFTKHTGMYTKLF